MTDCSSESLRGRFIRAVDTEDAALLDRCLAEGYPCLHPENSEGGSFHILAQDGWIEGMEIAYRHSKDVDARNANGTTPLQMAVREGKVESVKWLLDHGADPNAPGMNGWRALNVAAKWACIMGEREMLDLLLSRGAVHDIYSLVFLGEPNAVRGYLGEHPDAVRQYPNRASLIGEAVSAWEYRVTQDSRFCPPVGEKAYHGLRILLELLIQHGANINDHDGSRTALHEVAASRSSSPYVVKMLIDLDADVNARTSEGQTPLDLALSVNAPFADFLKAHGAVSFSPGENGEEIFLRE